MPPRVTVLQLDTRFPRVPGDVACPDTFTCDPEILRIPRASVGKIVTDHPEQIDIAPFETALDQASGDIIVTSCGFLSSWQSHLATRTKRPFLSSALIALDRLSKQFNPDELLILTFDQASLTDLHFGTNAAYRHSAVGLDQGMHLRQVIAQDHLHLDTKRAQRELVDLVKKAQRPSHKHILLECTNLPPYKPALTTQTGLPVTDILTCTETICSGAVQPRFLT